MGEAAQADYSSDYESSHGVDATRRAMYNGLIYMRQGQARQGKKVIT